jgi:ATP-dependent Zn protease
MANNFERLANELIDGSDSLVDKYNEHRNRFPYDKITKERLKNLKKEYSNFTSLSVEFQKNYTELFKEKGNQKEEYLKIGELHINMIQTLYLNRIGYEISQKTNDKSLLLAWAVAIVSIILSIASITFTIIYGEKSTPCSNLRTPDLLPSITLKNT